MNIRDLIGEATEYDKKLELDVTQDVTQDVNSNDLDTQIIYLIKKDDKISTEQMFGLFCTFFHMNDILIG